MLSLTVEAQIHAYASLGGLEVRALEIESLVSRLKRRCLDGGPGALADMVGAAAELRWQIRQLAADAGELDTILGVRRDGAPPPDTRRDSREFSGLRGTTDVVSVPDLVSLLSSLAKTGTLTIQAGESMFVLEFLEGSIVHTVTNRPNPELRLGTILVAQNKLTEEQLQQSLAAIAGSHALLGAQLVSSATVTASDLRGALELQVRKVFEDVFALKGARFTFVEGSISNIDQRVSMNTTHLLLEAARQRDEDRKAPAAATGTAGELDSILRG